MNETNLEQEQITSVEVEKKLDSILDELVKTREDYKNREKEEKEKNKKIEEENKKNEEIENKIEKRKEKELEEEKEEFLINFENIVKNTDVSNQLEQTETVIQKMDDLLFIECIQISVISCFIAVLLVKIFADTFRR